MRLTIIFKDEFEEYMKKQFGSFTKFYCEEEVPNG